MKVDEFIALSPNCIVCGSEMKCKEVKTIGRSIYTSDLFYKDYYNIHIICSRNEKCFGYLSNEVSTYDVIELREFYLSFPDIVMFSSVDNFTRLIVNNHNMIIAYIPFKSWISSKGRIKEKIYKLLPLVNGNIK